MRTAIVARTRATATAIRSPIQTQLEDLHARYAGLTAGEVATYIPELAKANPAWFGISLATTDGRVYAVGDSSEPFTIQSISKPFTYGLALEDRGRDAVLAKIDVEPTGDAFNAISLSPGSGRPLNPMINAGAIAAASLIAGHSDEDKLARLLSMASTYAGRPLAIDQAVYESELATAHRNRAIGHMLRNFDIIREDPEPTLDLYFRQCSIAVTCRDLSLMAATLANGGTNPLTGERAIREDLVASVLSVMATCGMYDCAGEWVYWVGMPAKSGVAGGVLAVLPGQLGIGVFSPRLDARGNSVRGVAVCKDLSQEFGLHFLRAARSSRSAIRAQYSLAGMRSKHRRAEHEMATLDAEGERVRVYELQGDLAFSVVEAVVCRIVDRSERIDFALLDVARVTWIDGAAARLLRDLCLALRAGDKQLCFIGAERHAGLLRPIEEALALQGEGGRGLNFADADLALEWCEKQLLRRYGTAQPPAAAKTALSEQEMCRGLEAQSLGHLEALMERRQYAAGEFIVHAGDAAADMFLLVNGQVSVVVTLPSGQLKRLATLTPGMAFGELASVTRSARSADIRADETTDCYLLSADAFDRLGTTHPVIKMVLLENMLRQAHDMVTRLNREVAALG